MRSKFSRLPRPSRAVLYLALAVTSFFYAYPFFWMVSGSLKSRAEFFQNGLRLLPQKLVLTNYAEAWQIARFGVYFKNSFLITLTTTGIVVLLTSMAGYALAKSDFPGKRMLIGAVVLSLFLPKGYAIIPIFDLVKRLGLLNTLWAVILVNSATSMVVNTFLFVGYFTTLPRALDEAARIDGASHRMIYTRIAMPLAKPMIATVALFEFIDNWNSFFIPLVFTLGRPDLRTVSVGMYAFVGQHATYWTLMCAAAVMSLLPTLLLFFMLQRLFVEGVVGAMRG
jgi:ABC-type glycerol-3-phosphate transport system permease component